MKFNLKINGSESPKAEFIGWTPVRCSLSVDEYDGTHSLKAIITPENINKSGRIALYNDNKTSSIAVDKIEHDFQTQNELTFFVAGVFGNASVGEKDTYILVVPENPAENNIDALRKNIMVRVRKNAENLTQSEIKIFLDAFVGLEFNSTPNQYEGNFSKTPSKLLHEIVLMHTFEAAYEIHRRTSFHPWHRAYLMHLEREMQNIDPKATVPYWKFDEAAPNVFETNFIGKTKASRDIGLHIGEFLRPDFDESNPLNYYKENTVWGPLRRAYRYNNPADGKSNPSIVDEDIIINFSDDFRVWCNFEETRSHNQAHVAFTGHIVDIGKDPVDPLFFMMHANVDRLWAKWQDKYNRFDHTDPKVYPYQGAYSGPRGNEWRDSNKDKFLFEDGYFAVNEDDLGNYVEDKLWPWGKDNELSRPWRKWYQEDYGCGNVPFLEIDFPSSESSNYSVDNVTVGSTIDYQDRINNETILGFDYDDIPYFESDRPAYPENQIDVVAQNEIFLDNNKSDIDRLLAAKSALLHSNDDQGKAISILLDKAGESIEIRLRSLQLINEGEASFLEAALQIISDESEDTELRSELIHKMLLARRANRSFHSRKHEFLDILRGLIKSNNQILRTQAFEILSSFGDHNIQDILVKEIQEPDNKLLNKSDAIFLLRQSAKNQHTKLFRNIIENTNENPETKIEAIKGLVTEKDSDKLLLNVLMNNTEDVRLRDATMKPLWHINQELTFELAPKILLESKELEGINIFSQEIPDPIEVNFKTTLLGILMQTPVSKLRENDELINSLRELIDTDSTMKLSYKNVRENSLEESTVHQDAINIEKVAIKLLNKIEDNEIE